MTKQWQIHGSSPADFGGDNYLLQDNSITLCHYNMQRYCRYDNIRHRYYESRFIFLAR